MFALVKKIEVGKNEKKIYNLNKMFFFFKIAKKERIRCMCEGRCVYV